MRTKILDHNVKILVHSAIVGDPPLRCRRGPFSADTLPVHETEQRSGGQDRSDFTAGEPVSRHDAVVLLRAEECLELYVDHIGQRLLRVAQ